MSQTQPQTPAVSGHDADESFERTVAFEKANDDEQIVRGAILVADELDHQLDYFRADTIRDLASNYGERFADGDVYGGVMHSIFPDGAVELVESEVLEEGETIGDEHYPAGTWAQSYHVPDDELWALIEDGILRGYSIGGTAKGMVTDPIPDDVRVPDEVANGVPDEVDPHELPGREITEGRIMESSMVDHPAVPRATHEEHKAAALQKGNPALTGSIVEARLYLEGRGHSPNDAKRLAEYLQTHKAADDEPAKNTGTGTGILARMKALVGGGDAQQPAEPAESGRDADADAGASKNLHELMDEDEFSDVLKDIQTTQDELNERMDALDTDADGGTDNGDEIELSVDGETVTLDSDDLSDAGRTAIENALADAGDGTEKDADDDPDRVDDLADKVDDLAETTKTTNELVLRMADANGVSKQADIETGGAGGTEKQEGLDGLAGLMG